MIQKILVIFLIFVLNVSPVLASQHENLKLPNVYIQPGTIYYSLIRAWEKFSYNFAFTKQSKIDFNRNLFITKVAELKDVVEDKKLGEVETSSERVSYYSGILTDSIIDKYHSDESKDGVKQVKNETVSEFKTINMLLSDLRDQYSANSSFWMLIQHSINSINAQIEKLENEIK